MSAVLDFVKLEDEEVVNEGEAQSYSLEDEVDAPEEVEGEANLEDGDDVVADDADEEEDKPETE